MSISTEIARLQGLRDSLKDALVSLGVGGGATLLTTLDKCVNAVKSIVNNGGVTGNISTVDGAYNVPEGYHNGTGSVKILPAEQAKLIPANIKNGVTVLGVAGSLDVGDIATFQSKTVTPIKEPQTIKADEGYDALSGVVVNPIPDEFADISGVTASMDNVLATKVFVDSTGAIKTGTMVNNGAINKTLNGTTEVSCTIPGGYHTGTGKVTLDNTIETALASI